MYTYNLYSLLTLCSKISSILFIFITVGIISKCEPQYTGDCQNLGKNKNCEL